MNQAAANKQGEDAFLRNPIDGVGNDNDVLRNESDLLRKAR